KDRLDPVDPAARLELSPGTLTRFPEGYRHLAYLQAGLGYDVKADMPGLAGPEVDALYRRGNPGPAGGPPPPAPAPPAAPPALRPGAPGPRCPRWENAASQSALGIRAAAAAGGSGGCWTAAAA